MNDADRDKLLAAFTRGTGLAPRKGHRPAPARLLFGPKVTVRSSSSITRTITQMLCGECGEPARVSKGRWIHGPELDIVD